jgi:hypothetical protein
MVASPKDFIGTRFELQSDVETRAALYQALLEKTGQIKLLWTASGTSRELRTRIIKGDDGQKWDVFLFIGHGHEGSVIFEEDGGSGFELISADVLKGILDAPNGPKVIVLNSLDRLVSTAKTLVRGGGIAAVVAMQFDISETFATTFTAAFFSNLMLNVPIEQTMALTRFDLQSQGFTEWISPVLYT